MPSAETIACPTAICAEIDVSEVPPYAYQFVALIPRLLGYTGPLLPIQPPSSQTATLVHAATISVGAGVETLGGGVVVVTMGATTVVGVGVTVVVGACASAGDLGIVLTIDAFLGVGATVC